MHISSETVPRTSYVNMMLATILADLYGDGAVDRAKDKDFAQIIDALDAVSPRNEMDGAKLDRRLYRTIRNLVDKELIDFDRYDFGKVKWILGEAEKVQTAEDAVTRKAADRQQRQKTIKPKLGM